MHEYLKVLVHQDAAPEPGGSVASVLPPLGLWLFPVVHRPGHPRVGNVEHIPRLGTAIIDHDTFELLGIN